MEKLAQTRTLSTYLVVARGKEMATNAFVGCLFRHSGIHQLQILTGVSLRAPPSFFLLKILTPPPPLPTPAVGNHQLLSVSPQSPMLNHQPTSIRSQSGHHQYQRKFFLLLLRASLALAHGAECPSTARMMKTIHGVIALEV